MTAKEQAIKDIKEFLKSEGKCFLAFRKELNPVIDKIIDRYQKTE